MDILALLGGTPVRTRPFSSWPIFGERKRPDCCARCAAGTGDGCDGNGGRGVREPFRRDARLPARHRRGQRHGFVAHRAAGCRHPRRRRGHRSALHVHLDGIGGHRGQCHSGFRRHRSGYVQPRSRSRRVPPSRRAPRPIIPVHFAGQPADMDAIMAIAREAAADVYRRCRARPRRNVSAAPGRIARPPGLVLVPVQQEPHRRRGRHHHHE